MVCTYISQIIELNRKYIPKKAIRSIDFIPIRKKITFQKNAFVRVQFLSLSIHQKIIILCLWVATTGIEVMCVIRKRERIHSTPWKIIHNLRSVWRWNLWLFISTTCALLVATVQRVSTSPLRPSVRPVFLLRSPWSNIAWPISVSSYSFLTARISVRCFMLILFLIVFAPFFEGKLFAWILLRVWAHKYWWRS